MIVGMLPLRLCLAIALVVATAYACDCMEPSVQDKKEYADVIFRGTIIELRDGKAATDLESGWVRDTGKMAVFRISQVWKGDVGETFEMPAVEETSACVGFWRDYLKVGADLLVYARRIRSGYYTSICGSHKPAKDASGKDAKDFKVLGPGAAPPKKKDHSSK